MDYGFFKEFEDMKNKIDFLVQKILEAEKKAKGGKQDGKESKGEGTPNESEG